MDPLEDRLEREYQKALNLVGDIKPWPSEGEYFFCDDQEFPTVMYMAPTVEETIEGYKRVLKGFIADYRAGNVADEAIRMTPSWGGERKGAGRPKEGAKVRMMIPEDIARWIRRVGPEGVRKAMQG